jgi:plastocyanin
MKRSELISRILITVSILGAVGTPFFVWARTPLIHARVAENGGWNPGTIKAKIGEPLHLKLTSDDVVHGFAVGQMNMEGVDVLPGKVTDITVTFDKPGIYTFFCTRWCGLNHWRMRGTIEVGGSSAAPQPAAIPMYVTLNLNIDASHDAPVVPGSQPSAISGQQYLTDLQIDRSMNTYRTNSPYQVFDELKNTSLTETQRWDVVASIWQSNTTKESLLN